MRLTILGLGFVLATSVSAQVSVGLRAGFSGARLLPQEGTIVPAWYRLGYTVGAIVSLPVTPSVSVRPEVLYVQKGSRIFWSQTTLDSDGLEQVETILERRLDYVEVPILAHVTSPAGGRFRIGLMAGPALAIKVREGAGIGRYINGESEPFPPGSIVVVSNYAPADVGLIVGGDVALGPVAVDVRYTAGLTQVDRHAVEPSERHGVVSAALSYRYQW